MYSEEYKITSCQNQLVKGVVKLHQKKYRDEKGLIILEGKKALMGAVESSLQIEFAFCEDDLIINEFKNCDFTIYRTTSDVMQKIATTSSAPVIVAVAKKPVYNLEDFKKLKKIALFDGIKDSGNLGTVIRAACAFGIEGIILYGECTDEYSPKAIRSAAGNMFKIPIVRMDRDTTVLNEFKNSHIIISTVVNSDKTVKDTDFSKPFIIMFGSEAQGLCKELLNFCDYKITLKMENAVESLNLAICAGIIFYEIHLKY